VQKVWVEVCGENDPRGPKGWPVKTWQYDPFVKEIECPVEGAINMMLEEFQPYCVNHQQAYMQWEKNKSAPIVESPVCDPALKAEPKVEASFEPETHESYAKEVKKKSHHKKGK
jgi:hypothetical protein